VAPKAKGDSSRRRRPSFSDLKNRHNWFSRGFSIGSRIDRPGYAAIWRELSGDKAMVEAKTAERSPDRSLLKFPLLPGVPAVQLLDEGDTFPKLVSGTHPVLVAPAWTWLPRLPEPGRVP
jgi:hypothetical protein